MKAVRDINKMGDWEILTYLRLERKWMVQSHYSKEDIENDFGLTFKEDEDWEIFTEFACNSFDDVKFEVMNAIVQAFE